MTLRRIMKYGLSEPIVTFAGRIAERAKEGIFILAGDANNFTPETLNAVLQEIPIPVLGGILPEIIYGPGRANDRARRHRIRRKTS